MKAVALSPSRDPELVDQPDPRPAADEVVIRPHYCGICGSDLHTKDNQTATRLGADQALAPDEAPKALAGGELAPVGHVFECSGHPTSVQLGIDLLAPGGSLRLVGVSPRPVSFDPFTAITKEASILTGFIYVEGEFAQAVMLLASAAVDVDTLTTAVVLFERFADAFAALRPQFPPTSARWSRTTRAFERSAKRRSARWRTTARTARSWTAESWAALPPQRPQPGPDA